MASTQILVAVVCLSLFCSVSASTVISDVVFGQQIVNGRRLLQAPKPCPVNFENQNYSIITSRCKPPDYPAAPCCEGFKEFACPFADNINDLTTDCARRMFSYINTIGGYPPGLFASLCREGKDGLACPVPPPTYQLPSASLTNKSGASMMTVQCLALLLFSLLFVM